ncbi:MAG: hypothetical protein JOZ77_01800 [Candidatus Eremiobacteraeota bacterium]|nr:hypothetical protein [Candidatus Eremiobacteraeota bacterium]
MSDLLRLLARTVDTDESRETRAQKASEIVSEARGYRWVGIYDVGDEEITLIGATQPVLPARLRFDLDEGLSGKAVRARESVVGESEVIVPILGAESGIVIGTLDAQSDRGDASSDENVAFLEECASVLRPLFD